MNAMFSYALSFNQNLPWNAWHLVDMGRMFLGAINFKADLTQFYTGNVYNMEQTFAEMEYNGDVTGWDVSNVGNTVEM